VTSLLECSAVELLDLYRRRATTPSDIIEAVIAHAEAREPALRALWAFDPSGARRVAAESTRRWAAGDPCGPLDGVPATVKENIATKGVAVPLGTAATTLTPAAADAPPAARLREAGAVIFAKTTMPDYGMLSSGLSSFHPASRNPWHLERTPGGSSAGAAAAGAAGYGPLHIGTDIGGSNRLPAGWCGLVGLKPSHGRVPIDPAYLGRAAGPMTRTVADAALMMSVLSRPDWRDPTSLPPQDIAWSDLEASPKGLRIGLMLDIGAGLEPAPEVRATITAAAGLFEQGGALIEPVRPILTRALLDGLDDFWRVRAFEDVNALPPEKRDLILPYIRAWAESGASRTALDVMRGFNGTHALRRESARLFSEFDFILSPTAPVVAFPAEHASPLHDPERPFEHIGYTVPWNMAENPAVSINAGYDGEGLPIGLQIVGRRFDDLGVLRMARFFEQARPAQRPWPIKG
jgi:aspartyl-tRNA(Asn)/glutamyl-tRNA(Gln) amidotransferase subunit A